MPFPDFASDLSDLTDADSSEDEVPLASKHSASRKSNKDRDHRARKSLRPPRVTQFSTKTLYEQVIDGTIDLDPEYQRDIVWPEAKQSGLIDSILYNFYLPPIIFAVYPTKDGNDKRVCIDGKQRLTSIQRFMDGFIPHRDCYTSHKSWYKSQPGQAQKRLSEQQRRNFINKQIVCIEYENLTADQEREIFQRVQLGVPLTPAERMQAITGPWPNFIRSIQQEVLGEHGFEGYIDWGRARGRDFQCLASIAYLASKYPTLSHPAAVQLDRWLQDMNQVPQLLRSRLESTFRIFVYIARDDKLRGPLQHPNRVSPVEFVMIGLLIFVHSPKLSMTQLSSAIEKLRTNVRAEFIDIRMNTRTLKHMFAFVEEKMAPRRLRSDGKGDVPAATFILQRKSSKRKRLLLSDDDDDDVTLKPRKGKSSDIEKPTKPQKQSKLKSAPEDTSKKLPKPPTPLSKQKWVNLIAITKTGSTPIVKPPIPPSQRLIGSTSTNSAMKSGSNSTPVLPSPPRPQIAANSTSVKVEPDQPKPPVPLPPSRKLSIKFPPPASNVAPPPLQSNAISPPSTNTTPLLVTPPVPSPILPTPANYASPIAAPVVPALPPPPPQTQVVVKRESSPLDTALNFDYGHPPSVSDRLAPLRAARAAVGGARVDLNLGSTISSQQQHLSNPPQPSPIIPQASPLPSPSSSASLVTQDPRRRPKSQPPRQQPDTVMRNDIEDLLLRGSLRNPSSESISPTTASPSPLVSSVPSNLGVGVDVDAIKVQINGLASEGANNVQVSANLTTVHNSSSAQADMSINPEGSHAPQQSPTTPLSSHPHNHQQGLPLQAHQNETKIISATVSDLVSNHTTTPNTSRSNANPDNPSPLVDTQKAAVPARMINLFAIASKALSTPNGAFPSDNLTSVPSLPRSQSSAAIFIADTEGVETSEARSPHAHDRGRRDHYREVDSRYESYRRRRHSPSVERDGYYRRDYKHRDSRYRERDRSWSRDRDRERYRGWESDRGYDHSSRNSGGRHRDRRWDS